MTNTKPTPISHGNWQVINDQLVDVKPEPPAEPEHINLVHDQSVEEE